MSLARPIRVFGGDGGESPSQKPVAASKRVAGWLHYTEYGCKSAGYINMVLLNTRFVWPILYETGSRVGCSLFANTDSSPYSWQVLNILIELASGRGDGGESLSQKCVGVT